MKNTNMNKLALAIGSMTIAGAAWAVDDSSTMTVDATIAEACMVGAGGGIAFGSLEMLDSAGVQIATDSVTASTFPAICTNGTTFPTFTYTSVNTSGTDFRLKGAVDDTVFITYTPYPTANGTGTAIVGGAPVAHPDFSANGVSQSLALSGKITAAAKAAKKVQGYSDTITITVSFGA